MGILGSSYSFSCFRAEVPEGLTDVSGWVVRVLSTHSFREEVEGLSKRIGWTSPFEPFSPQFDVASSILGDFAIFSMRIDERKVPRALLKKYLALEELKYMEEKGIKRLPRLVKKKLRERVEFMLLQKVLPVPTIIDVAWDLEEGIVYFFSTSSKVIGEFQGFFKRSFEIMPEPLIPYTMAEGVGGPDLLRGLTPDSFVS